MASGGIRNTPNVEIVPATTEAEVQVGNESGIVGILEAKLSHDGDAPVGATGDGHALGISANRVQGETGFNGESEPRGKPDANIDVLAVAGTEGDLFLDQWICCSP